MHKTTHDRPLTGRSTGAGAGSVAAGVEEQAQAVRAEERGGGLRL